jgi:hypothetical protein
MYEYYFEIVGTVLQVSNPTSIGYSMEKSRIGRSLIVKDDKGQNHFLSVFTDAPEIGGNYRFVIGAYFGGDDVVSMTKIY